VAGPGGEKEETPKGKGKTTPFLSAKKKGLFLQGTPVGKKKSGRARKEKKKALSKKGFWGKREKLERGKRERSIKDQRETKRRH